MKFFHLIWGNLKRKKLRTALTLLSIVVAFILFGLMSSIKQALTGGVSMEGVNRLIVQHKVPIFTPLWRNADGKQTWEFDIVGIFDGKTKNTDTMSLFFRYDYFDEARPFAKGQVGWYTVRVKDPSQAAEVAKRIDEEFLN